jgi:hypothetical protein
MIAWSCAKTISDTVEDVTITARVKTVLLNDTELDATKIDVDTTQGVVTLSGTVRSSAEETRAIELVRRTPGVKEVNSTLLVSPSLRPCLRGENVIPTVTRTGTGWPSRVAGANCQRLTP